MRTFGIALLLFCANTVFAHGGGSFRGPPPSIRSIECDCAKIECKKCSNDTLRARKGFICERKTTEVKHWGDVAQVLTTITFTTDRRRVEGYARIESPQLLASFTGHLSNGEDQLIGALQKSQEGRRKYLYARHVTLVDPLLATRRGANRVDVRVFPVVKGTPAIATVGSYTLRAPEASTGVRLYRTGERVLAILPLAEDANFRTAALIDTEHDRTLHFLDAKPASKRYPDAAATEVPFVPALETALTGKGDRAAGDEKVLAALPKDAALPPFIGPPRPGSRVPPGLREPTDPEPPPPPPPATDQPAG